MSDQNRRTPPWLFKKLQTMMPRKFTIDLFASSENALCSKYFDAEHSAFVNPWPKGLCFGNPPFKMFGAAIRRAHDQATERDVTTVLVGPVGCSQKWFHEVARWWTILVPDQRISFFASDGSGPTPGANRDTMIYIVGAGWENQDPSRFRIEPFAVRGLVVTRGNMRRLMPSEDW